MIKAYTKLHNVGGLFTIEAALKCLEESLMVRELEAVHNDKDFTIGVRYTQGTALPWTTSGVRIVNSLADDGTQTYTLDYGIENNSFKNANEAKLALRELTGLSLWAIDIENTHRGLVSSNVVSIRSGLSGVFRKTGIYVCRQGAPGLSLCQEYKSVNPLAPIQIGADEELYRANGDKVRLDA